MYLSHLNITHNNEEVEMTIREWMPTQTPYFYCDEIFKLVPGIDHWRPRSMWEDNIKCDLKEICVLGQGSVMGSCKSTNEPACSL
jgi:hypothetical protein